jgi:SAM-dependent methyltransferase
VNVQELFSYEDIRKTYEEVDWHRRCKDIIQEYALNTKDIRDVALEGVDLSHVHRVLDLGCGYGFFTERLCGRLNSQAHITGIDVIEKNNRDSFLRAVNQMGYTGTFIQGSADIITDMAQESFDLVIASFSLYFFPHMISRIAKVLRRTGLFIAVTHSRHTLHEVIRFVPSCMRAVGLTPPDDLRINRLFRMFSLEEGASQLSPHFEEVERILYENSLVFPFDQFDECVEYLDTKKHLIFKEVSEMYPYKIEDVAAAFNMALFEHARLHGKVLITKDDGIFRCRLPVHDRRS